MHSARLALSLVISIASVGCDDGISCGVDLIYNRAERTCVCPPDRVWDDDAGTCFAVDGGCIERNFYLDGDEDGHGDPAEVQSACASPPGYVFEGNDCDDSRADANPGAPESCNSLDDDCDESTDEGVMHVYYRDADGDGYGDEIAPRYACAMEPGYVENATDCNDARATAHPGAVEACNGVDDDCDDGIDEGLSRSYYRDSDGDRFGDPSDTVISCALPIGFVEDSTDCDDARAAAHPAASELCNALDDDCSSGGGPEPSEDADGDGHAPTAAACITGPAGTPPRDDCRDDDVGIGPQASGFHDVPACRSGFVPCYGPYRDVVGGPSDLRWGCILSGSACDEPQLLRFAAFWDWNCDGIEERRAPATPCGPGPLGACTGGGPVYDVTMPPVCGTPTTLRTCRTFGGSGCLADESMEILMSCR